MIGVCNLKLKNKTFGKEMYELQLTTMHLQRNSIEQKIPANEPFIIFLTDMQIMPKRKIKISPRNLSSRQDCC